jgi:threonine synthase
MDISKASNFERFVFDALGRDAARTRALFAEVETRRAFALDAGERDRIGAFGFVSGRSTSADRLATIADVQRRFGEVIDPHTADALKVGRDHAEAATPVVVLETALAAKFNETIRQAIGVDAPRPARLAGLEALPRRFATLPVDVARLKAFIAENARQ